VTLSCTGKYQFGWGQMIIMVWNLSQTDFIYNKEYIWRVKSRIGVIKRAFMNFTDLFMNFWGGLIRWFFQLLYHQFSFAYDWVAAWVSGGKWKEWVYESGKFFNDEPILEIGFGPGHLQKEYLLKGKHIFGLDESRFMCHLARKRLEKLNLAGKQSSLCRGIAQYLPFAGDSFSTILMTFPTQYALDERTIGECWRVLRSQGKIVILLAVRQGGDSLYKRLIRWLFGITHQSPNNEAYQTIWTQRYGAAGFRVEQVWHRLGDDHLWFVVAEKESTPFANG